MNRNELERAWPASEPSAGFAERVLERAQRAPAPPEPAARRARSWRWLSAGRRRWLVVPGLALSMGLAAALLLWLARPAGGGDVIAAEPRTLSIGERVVAEMSNGAHLRWSGDSADREVWQGSGEVTYRVVPGTDFRVQTPYGSVAVLGTVFRVFVAERAAADGVTAEGESMKKRWSIAGAGATAGALLWVSVDRGSVRLSKGSDELVLGPGPSGAVAADGVPRLAAEEPAAPTNVQDERARARQVADAVRRHAARRRAAMQAKEQPSAEPSTSKQAASPPAERQTFRLPDPAAAPPASGSPPATSEEQARRREYIQRTMHEQYFPIARDCYQELLGRQPKASGKVVLEFAIVGDGDAGVVDRVATRDDENMIDDPEFVMCMRESLYTAVFEPPPPGASETTVVYPVVLEPGE